jgi:hypothetical protein
LFEEFLFGDDALAVLHEIDEHVETLGLEGAEGVAVTEFVTLRIELVIAKDIEHDTTPSQDVSFNFRHFKHDELLITRLTCELEIVT